MAEPAPFKALPDLPLETPKVSVEVDVDMGAAETPAIPERYHVESRKRITLSPRAQNILAATLDRMVREGWVDLLAVPDESELIEFALEHAARTIEKTRWDLVADESRAARKGRPKEKRTRRKPKA